MFNRFKNMGVFETFKTAKVTKQEEYLKVHPTRGYIEAQIRMISFKDKDTNQFVISVPSLEITGYGSTKKRAMEMIKSSIDDFNSNLINKNINTISSVLVKLGWKKSPLRNKNFSKSYIDINGELKDFNIVGNKIETEFLTLA